MYKTEFCVEVDNKPGQLAKVCAALKYTGTTVLGIATERIGNQTFIRLVVEKEEATRNALETAGFLFSEGKVVLKSFTNNLSGLYEIAQKFSASNVNIDSIYLVTTGANKVNFVFSTEKPRETAQLLG